MTITEIKKEILERVNQLDDDWVLEDVYRILQAPFESKVKFVFSQVQKDNLDAIEKEIDNGLYVTNEQSEKDLDEWLK
jgi:predicted transcriptional regulator